MAVNEISGFLKYKDSSGDTNLLLPITTKDNVDGLDEIENNIDSLNDHVANNDIHFTVDERNKLRSIEADANKTVVDSTVSATSTNPVQNKAIKDYVDNAVADKIDTETDPTVPTWAKAATKPSYTASEVGAVPTTRTINGKALSSDISLSASDVGALPNTTQIPSITGLATETYVNNKVAAMVDSAPDALNTLNELAAALGDDPNFATTFATQIGNKVDKVSGKGLSTNDFTNADKTKLDNTNIAYGTCSTAAETAEKAVVLNGNIQWSLKTGSIIMVKFDVSNTASNVTLNVNDTGAYPIWYNNAEYTSNATAYTGYANRTITYMFNGTHYVWITSSYDDNSTYTNAALGQGYATCSTAAATAAKVGSLSSYKLVTGGIVSVKFTNAVPANATLNINSTGAKSIYFRGAKITADVIKAGDVATFVYSSYYHLISIDRWQNDISAMQTQISNKLDADDIAGLATETYVNNAISNIDLPSGYVVKSAAPTDKSVLWVDMDDETDETANIVPVKGIDYWTEEDKAEVVTEATVIVQANATQQTPLFAESIDECTDTSKVYVLPDGYVYGYMSVETTETPLYTNQLPIATNPDGSIYDGDGYKEGIRLSCSSGSFVEKAETGWCASGLIPAKGGDTIRLKNCVFTKSTTAATHRGSVYGADSSGAWNSCNIGISDISNASGEWRPVFAEDGDNIIQFTIPNYFSDAYIRIVVQEFTSDSIITVNEEIIEIEAGTDGGYSWQSTGHAFVPADYEDRVIACENKVSMFGSNVNSNTANITSLTNRVASLENGSVDEDCIPTYWLTHLEERADDIREAMENAGRNKSSFLWYSDAHWNYGSQMSPKLLMYLYQRTPINKINFGGDIINNEPTDLSDRDTMRYLWEWRDMIRELPNHHSVIGNHDDGNTTNKLFPESYIYAYLLAPEENNDIVLGDGFYYYMDDKSEKTRYLYLDTAYENYSDISDTQLAFVKDAIKTVPANWHIVAIAHIWHNTDYTVNPPTVSGFCNAATKLLAMFDQYNARSGEYSTCGGRVEFCIGGHCHSDNDSRSDGGIPVILTETDSKHVRSGLTYTTGTITEASVNGIIADYNNNKITVVRIGRGSGRVISIE